MSVSSGAADGQGPPVRRRTLVQLNLRRVAVAGALLAALFALLFFVLLPRGGDDSVSAARMVDTPSGLADASLGVRPGRLARDFEASDLEGLPVRLSELRGQPVVINFWATWCTSCSAEMPVLEEQRQRYRSDGLTVLAVNVGEPSSDARGFIEALELFDFTVAMDIDLTISDAYGVRGLPHSIFIDSNGVIQAEYRGQLDDETMQRFVQAAIDAVPGGEAPFRIRLLNTVPRQHILEVLPDEGGPGQVLFLSRRFRCDDAYCGEPALELLRALPAVTEIDLDSGETPPVLTVSFDPDVIDLDGVVSALADALRMHPDPLYTLELEIRYP